MGGGGGGGGGELVLALEELQLLRLGGCLLREGGREGRERGKEGVTMDGAVQWVTDEGKEGGKGGGKGGGKEGERTSMTLAGKWAIRATWMP